MFIISLSLIKGACRDSRLIRFVIRMPFDSYAVFGSEEWREGVKRSKTHQKTLERIIAEGIESRMIPATNPTQAANCFWAVLVGNLFDFNKMLSGNIITPEESANGGDTERLHTIITFCFNGLRIKPVQWEGYLDKLIKNEERLVHDNEGV